jgi:hypothetical protein
MNKRIIKQSLLALSLLLFVTSCSDKYGDDLRGLGSRVEELEKKALEAGKEIDALWTLIKTIRSNGYVSNIIENSDGSFTVEMVYFTDPDDPNTKATKTYTVHPGTNGQEASLVISVKQDPYDGEWYWVLNGDWLKDAYGNRVRASGRDGKDGSDGTNGKDGKDGKDGVVPQVRINSSGMWEYSPDGGTTWISTGKPANGKDGQNGKDGEDGRPDIFKSFSLSEDGKWLTITLSTGESFTVPIKQD